MYDRSAITLEIIVLLLGIFLLLAECLQQGGRQALDGDNLRSIILAIVFGWSFFTNGNAGVRSEDAFYTADATALFFKRIALLTTIVVLVMALEYKGSAREVHSAGAEAWRGLGEFYACPSSPAPG